MKIGFLAAGNLGNLEQTIKWAKDNGFQSVQLVVPPENPFFDVEKVANGEGIDEIKKLTEENNVIISSLGFYSNPMDPDQEKRERNISHFKMLLKAAANLDVKVVSGWIGILPGGVGSERIAENMKVYSDVWPGIVELAERLNVRIAIENCLGNFATRPEVWEKMFEITPSEAIGLEFDPSHLVLQMIDVLEAARKFAKRIYHTHCKDGYINRWKLAECGYFSSGWFSGRIPGFGEVDWYQLVSILRSAGYDYVLNIEHEDPYLGFEEGLIIGRKHLEKLIA